jgi:hypothetical protein
VNQEGRALLRRARFGVACRQCGLRQAYTVGATSQLRPRNQEPPAGPTPRRDTSGPAMAMEQRRRRRDSSQRTLGQLLGRTPPNISLPPSLLSLSQTCIMPDGPGCNKARRAAGSWTPCSSHRLDSRAHRASYSFGKAVGRSLEDSWTMFVGRCQEDHIGGKTDVLSCLRPSSFPFFPRPCCFPCYCLVVSLAVFLFLLLFLLAWSSLCFV